MRILYTLCFSLLLCTCVSAQRLAFELRDWQMTAVDDADGDRRITPTAAVTFRVDAERLREYLFASPHEQNVQAENSPARFTLPLPNGAATFRIVGYDISAAGDLAKYPGIRTWYGVNEDDARQTIYLDWTERGFHASIRGGGSESVFIDPVFRGDVTLYQAYRKSDLPTPDPFTCSVAGEEKIEGIKETDVMEKAAGGCELRQYRTTITTTGEYSNYHGAFSAAQSGLVQSAVVTSINRVNQIITRDLSLRLQLIAGNDRLYNYSVANDGFTGDEVADLIDENPPYVESIIGSANFDYGHIYSQGDNNGIAQTPSSCTNGKAAGATSHSVPENDPFNIDYVAHEMGHNFGANHTQNNNCNYSASAGMEPGSGSSIMGYAGICAPNVQFQSDDYYHGRSIEEVSDHVEFGFGATCGTIINTSLSTPTAVAQEDETIPAGTPFVLNSAGAGDGTLSFGWEQYDARRGAFMPPRGTNVLGPLFRGYQRIPTGERYFPRLPDVISGTDTNWEELPTVSRTMNFRSTIVNANATYGCATEDDIVVTVRNSGSPFTVSQPNGSWTAGAAVTVEWDVAGTDGFPFDADRVDILVSSDGGQTFSEVFTQTANDGSATFNAPIATTNDARVLVRGFEKVFYNVNGADFAIVNPSGAGNPTLTAITDPRQEDCFQINPVRVFTFNTSQDAGDTAPITWSVNGLPAGVDVTFSGNPVTPGESFALTLQGLGALPPGETVATLTGMSADGQFSQALTLFNTGVAASAGPAIVSPAGFVNDLRVSLEVADAPNVPYDFQVSTEPDFSTLVFDVRKSSSNIFILPEYLAGGTTYYWRARTGSDCDASQWSEASFQTTPACTFTNSTAAPVAISFGAPAVYVMQLDVTGQPIREIDVSSLDITHSYIQDLIVDLISPAGVAVRLLDEPCGNSNDINARFDDDGAAAFPCPPIDRGFYRPAEPLRTLIDTDPTGTWTLRVEDTFAEDGGSINGFGLKICVDAALPVNFISFTAKPGNKAIYLDWATEDEVDNEGFYVERRGADAGTEREWQELGFVAAGAEYTFTDATALPNTDYLYRLRQTDLDGKVSYSPIEAARYGSDAASSLVLFPNPTNGIINYRLGDAEDAVDYQLLDVTGKVLQTGTLLTAGGTLSLTNQAAGVYLLRAGGRTLRVLKL